MEGGERGHVAVMLCQGSDNLPVIISFTHTDTHSGLTFFFSVLVYGFLEFALTRTHNTHTGLQQAHRPHCEKGKA